MALFLDVYYEYVPELTLPPFLVMGGRKTREREEGSNRGVREGAEEKKRFQKNLPVDSLTNRKRSGQAKKVG